MLPKFEKFEKRQRREKAELGLEKESGVMNDLSSI